MGVAHIPEQSIRTFIATNLKNFGTKPHLKQVQAQPADVAELNLMVGGCFWLLGDAPLINGIDCSAEAEEKTVEQESAILNQLLEIVQQNVNQILFPQDDGTKAPTLKVCTVSICIVRIPALSSQRFTGLVICGQVMARCLSTLIDIRLECPKEKIAAGHLYKVYLFLSVKFGHMLNAYKVECKLACWHG